MSDDWWAFESLRQSFDDTEELLTPIDAGRWVRLIVISLLVGGTGGGFVSNLSSSVGNMASTSGTSSTSEFSAMTASMVAGVSPLVWAGLAVVLVLALGMMLLSSIAEFAFISMLRDEEFGLLDLFSQYTDRGLAYLGFQLGVMLIVLGLLGGPLGGLYALGMLSGGAVLAMLPYILVVIVITGFVTMFTRDVVIVAAMDRDAGIVETLRQMLSVLRQHPWETLVYWILRFVINVASGILVMLVLAAVLIPLVIVGAILGLVLSMVGIPSSLIALGLGVPGVLLLVALMLTVRMPITVYLRYYGINVYEAMPEA